MRVDAAEAEGTRACGLAFHCISRCSAFGEVQPDQALCMCVQLRQHSTHVFAASQRAGHIWRVSAALQSAA